MVITPNKIGVITTPAPVTGTAEEVPLPEPPTAEGEELRDVAELPSAPLEEPEPVPAEE